MREFNQDQTPLRQKPGSQYATLEQTDKANYNEGVPVQ